MDFHWLIQFVVVLVIGRNGAPLPVWPREGDARPPQMFPGMILGPFEVDDDFLYKDRVYVGVVVARGEEVRQRMLNIGLHATTEGIPLVQSPEEVGKSPEVDDGQAKLEVPPKYSSETLLKLEEEVPEGILAETPSISTLTEEPSSSLKEGPTKLSQSQITAIIQTTDIDTVAELRRHLERVRSAALNSLEAVDRLSHLTDQDLSSAAGEVFAQDVGFLLSGEKDARSMAIRDIQELLCPSLQKEARDLQEWMLEQVLESVGSLLGEVVTLEEMSKMHELVRFVDRFQGEFQLPEDEVADNTTARGVWRFQEDWKQLLERDGKQGSKTVKKVLPPT